MQMQLQPVVAMEDAEHQMLYDEIQRLAREIASMHTDVTPVLALYRRIEALGWLGRGLLWFVGALLAIGVAASKLWEVFNPPPGGKP